MQAKRGNCKGRNGLTPAAAVTGVRRERKNAQGSGKGQTLPGRTITIKEVFGEKGGEKEETHAWGGDGVSKNFSGEGGGT